MGIFRRRKHAQLDIDEATRYLNNKIFLSGEDWQTKVEQLLEFKFKQCPKEGFLDYIRLLQASFIKLEAQPDEQSTNELLSRANKHLTKVTSYYRREHLDKNELINDLGLLLEFGLTIAQHTPKGQTQRDNLYVIAKQLPDGVAKIPKNSENESELLDVSENLEKLIDLVEIGFGPLWVGKALGIVNGALVNLHKVAGAQKVGEHLGLTIDEADIKSLHPKAMLTDTILDAYVRKLNGECAGTEFFCTTTAQIQMLRHRDAGNSIPLEAVFTPEDLVKVNRATRIICPINDEKTGEKEGGSHWMALDIHLNGERPRVDFHNSKKVG